MVNRIELILYSVGNEKQQNHHAVLEDKLADATKKLNEVTYQLQILESRHHQKLNEVTNQLQILEKSKKRLSVSLTDKENKRPKCKLFYSATKKAKTSD